MGQLNILGVGGTDGSGKDTVVKLITEDLGWQYISVSDILRDELNKRGIELSRKNLRHLSAEWRRNHGLGVLVDKAVAEFNKKHPGLVIASLRNYGEADEIHKLGGKVIWIDADPKVRYERIISRQRGTEDQVSFEEFLAEEQEQMEHYKGDPNTLNLSGVKERADIFIKNNTNDVADLKKSTQKALQGILD